MIKIGERSKKIIKKSKQIACNLVYVWGYKVDKFYVPKAKEWVVDTTKSS